MLRFTKEQAAFVLNGRRAFNASQLAMAERHGLQNGQDMIGNALPLPRDVWGEWDREAVELQRTTLAVFNDLAGSVAMPMDIGKLVHHFQTVSDSGDATVSLDGRSKGRTDQPIMAYHGTPLPITSSPYSYGWRQVRAAASEGFQLDAAGRDNANRTVAEKLESLVLDGDASIVVGGDALYGLRTHPNRNTRTTGQALNGATGAQWVADMNATLKLLQDKNFRVPATVYVNWADWRYAQTTDFKAESEKTIATRIMEDGMIRNVVPSDSVAAGQIIAVIKDSRSLQVLNGMPLTNRAQFRANPEDDYNFVSMAAASLEIKYDADSNCGVAVSTLA